MINWEGMVAGEGRGKRILKKIYIKPKGIDIGYGLEMTLASLSLYLELVGDKKVEAVFNKALKAHLHFIYPNGSLDNSIGSRGYKWTLYGSKTTHGSQMALAYGAARDPYLKRVLKLTVKFLNKFVVNGLLTYGYEVEPSCLNICLYPTAIKACNLAFALNYFSEKGLSGERLSTDKTEYVKPFRSLNSIIVRKKSWMATISGCGNSDRYPGTDGLNNFYVPGGGAVTCLYHNKWGLIQAATQLDYQVPELLHVPHVDANIKSLTPRICIHQGNYLFDNVHSRKVTIKHTAKENRIKILAKGSFVCGSDKTLRPAAKYSITYFISPDSFKKRYHVELKESFESLEIIEPILLIPDVHIVKNEQKLCLKRISSYLIIDTCSKNLWMVNGKSEKYWCPLPSVRGIPIIFKLQNPGKIEIEASITFRVE